MFKVNDRVKYVNRAFGDSIDNPFWGGIGGYIAGTVIQIMGTSIDVKWDNGCKNIYRIQDLKYVKKRYNLFGEEI